MIADQDSPKFLDPISLSGLQVPQISTTNKFLYHKSVLTSDKTEVGLLLHSILISLKNLPHSLIQVIQICPSEHFPLTMKAQCLNTKKKIQLVFKSANYNGQESFLKKYNSQYYATSDTTYI